MFWQEFLARFSSVDGLTQPVTSKDVDFEGSPRAVKRSAELLDGTPKFPDATDSSTTSSGLVVYVDSSGARRQIDFISEPFGLKGQDVRDTAPWIRVAADDGTDIDLRVMHPERCLESRVYNVEALGKTSALSIRQLKVSIVCAREWSRYLLDGAGHDIPKTQRVKAVLRINERIFKKCMNDMHFRALFKNRRVDPFEAVLWDHSALPAEFRNRRYPQMQDKLVERRAD